MFEILSQTPRTSSATVLILHESVKHGCPQEILMGQQVAPLTRSVLSPEDGSGRLRQDGKTMKNSFAST